MRGLWGENVVGWVLAVYGKLQALMGKLTGEPPIKIVCCLGKEDPEAAARAECPGQTIWLYRGWDVYGEGEGKQEFWYGGITGRTARAAWAQIMRTKMLLHEMMHLVGAVDWVYMWRIVGFGREKEYVRMYGYTLRAATSELIIWTTQVRFTFGLAGIPEVGEAIIRSELWRWVRRLDRINADTLACTVLGF